MPSFAATGFGLLALVCVAAIWNYILVRRLNRKMDALIYGLIGGEDPPPPPRKRPYIRWATTGLLILVLSFILALELLAHRVQGFWENSGLRTRKKPALTALHSYLYAADHSPRFSHKL